MATAIIVVIILAIGIISIKSSVKRVTHGCCGTGGETVKKLKAQDQDISHYPFHYRVEIHGMTCSNCKKTIENAFNMRSGFFAVVSLKNSEALIHMKEDVPEHEIMSIIWQNGYEPIKCETVVAAAL